MSRPLRSLFAVVLMLAATAAGADSFMSSASFAGGVTGKVLPVDLSHPLTAEEVLLVMDWKGLEVREHDLGGIRAPARPLDVLGWLPRHLALTPERRFLAAYKAIWEVEDRPIGAALLAEAQEAKALASWDHPDAAKQAAMALGIAVGTLQLEIFNVPCDVVEDEEGEPALAGANRDLWDIVTPSKLAAAASFAESLALTRSLAADGADQRALRSALQSVWQYARNYGGVDRAFRLLLAAEPLAWLEPD
jgi:hypothetical protein